MRKLAWLALILFVIAIIIITLGVTNYAGIGDTLSGFMRTSIIMPVRNFIVDSWLFVGSSGWYILAAVVGIGMVWIPFYYIVLKGFFWNKLIQQKVFHHTPNAAPMYQSAPTATIPITGLQSSPTQTPVPVEQKKQEK